MFIIVAQTCSLLDALTLIRPSPPPQTLPVTPRVQSPYPRSRYQRNTIQILPSTSTTRDSYIFLPCVVLYSRLMKNPIARSEEEGREICFVESSIVCSRLIDRSGIEQDKDIWRVLLDCLIWVEGIWILGKSFPPPSFPLSFDYHILLLFLLHLHSIVFLVRIVFPLLFSLRIPYTVPCSTISRFLFVHFPPVFAHLFPLYCLSLYACFFCNYIFAVLCFGVFGKERKGL